ncbi:ANTAR domain-containing protein [Nocardioides KLBMP 9356]|uniref:ANTAR domain-containing protein n=1 Tax=Nocardioides potassii TaxID=2911371 RepID=A0ABS9HF64_9ACTN|nr:ANTAR domain-containing protein [Nocardioides potassii]MCF6379179.1 ANTAR domain-containing protein [Nocardioides potassii]
MPHVHAVAVCFIDENLTLLFAWTSGEQSSSLETVRSSLALSFGSTTHVVASVTLYSDVTDAFVGDVRELEHRLGAVRGRSALDADLDGDMRRRALLAPMQLRAQRDVDTAVGLLMGMDGLSAEQAERLLDVMARTSGRSVEAVAAEIVAASGIFAGVDPPPTESGRFGP